MAQTNFTPIYLYNSGMANNTPLAANLGAGELAINYTDGKLFYKDNSSSIQVIGWKTTPTTAGGTGLTSYTTGDLPYYASGTTLSKLGIGTSGYVLESNGSAPTWVAQSTLSVGTATNATNTAITNNTSSSATWYLTIVSATTGNLPQTTSSTKLSFVPNTGVLSITGANLGGLTASSAVATDASKNLVSVTNTGTGNNVLATSPTLVTPILGVANATSIQFGSSTILNDYEEGTWSPGVGNLTVVGTFSSSGTYTKIGRFVTVTATLSATTSVTGNAGNFFTGLPFTPARPTSGSAIWANRGSGGFTETFTNGNVYTSGFGTYSTIYVTITFETT